MLRKSATAAPKLRCKAGEARDLIGFAVELADKYLSTTNEIDIAVKQCAFWLQACYSCLSRATHTSDELQSASRRFTSMYIALSVKVGSAFLWR